MDNIELQVIADAMAEKKGQNIVSLDLKSTGTAISDYFVVCNADSSTNVVAIADNVEDRMAEKCRRKVLRAQGYDNALWIILSACPGFIYSLFSGLYGCSSTRAEPIHRR